MNLHSCQLTKRKRRLPMANIQKKCVRSAVFKGHRAWSLPSTKAETEAFRFFSFSNCQIPGSFSCGVYCTYDTVQFLPSSLSTFLSISVHFLVSVSSSITFPYSFSLSFPSFRILCLWFSLLFKTTEFSLHCPCPRCQTLLSFYTRVFTWSTWHRSPERSKHLPKGRDDSVLVADLLTKWAWECHSPDTSWLCLKCWLPISTAGQFPLALVSLLQSWNLRLLRLHRLKNLKYFLWDRALTKGSIHLKCDAMGFHNPACRQTAIDKCLFITTVEVSSAFPISFSLQIRKVKVTF